MDDPNGTCSSPSVVCGIRVEDIEDETTRKVRYLDKLIDELAFSVTLIKSKGLNLINVTALPDP